MEKVALSHDKSCFCTGAPPVMTKVAFPYAAPVMTKVAFVLRTRRPKRRKYRKKDEVGRRRFFLVEEKKKAEDWVVCSM